MRRRRDNPRNAGIQGIGRNDAAHRADCRQAAERGAALSAQRAVFYDRTGHGVISYQPTGIAELPGQGDNSICLGRWEYRLSRIQNKRDV